MRVTDLAAPEAPENFRYEVLDNEAGTIRLSWTPPSNDVDYYELAFANDTTLQDHICDTLSDMIACTPVYHLECLPDAAAAQTAYNTIFSGVCR